MHIPRHTITPRQFKCAMANYYSKIASAPCARLHSRFSTAATREGADNSDLDRDGQDQAATSLLGSEQNPSPSSSPTTVNGWVRSIRRMKNVCFADIRDGSTLSPLQVVLTKQQAEGLSNGAAVQITGTWAKNMNQSAQKRELTAESVKLLGISNAKDYPLQKKDHSPAFLRTIPHLRCRTSFHNLMLRLRSWTIGRTAKFFGDNEFLQVHPPIFTSSDCEGAGEAFQVRTRKGDAQFFSQETYMTVSTQLHLEALAQSAPKVWSLSPTFRAEASDTVRHLSEFYMLEAEVSFIDDLENLTDLVENYMASVVGDLADSQVGKELLAYRQLSSDTSSSTSSITSQSLQDRWNGLAGARKWPRISYTEAISLLENAVASKRAHFTFPVSWGCALQSEHERFVATEVGKGQPIFITDFPSHIKPFYMLPSKTQPAAVGPTEDVPDPNRETVACFDLLFPDAGELAGGSLREHRYDQLKEKMLRYGVAGGDNSDHRPNKAAVGGASGHPESGENGQLDWYLDLRRWGTVPHGGFGIGFDRLLSYLSGTENIKDVAAFPRWSGRCDC